MAAVLWLVLAALAPTARHRVTVLGGLAFATLVWTIAWLGSSPESRISLAIALVDLIGVIMWLLGYLYFRRRVVA